ncbi:GNAT family N-acetyltransferase [Salinispora pacifica]|uniref:GNAT family N-acetyltransferase n=1 Tax=Salinispora pacifica TaxID=351187 RepID=UPI0004802DE4|nr:GNAT family protein [Salinispora pacifica]
MIFPHTESRRIALQPASTGDSSLFMQTLLRTGLESFRPAASTVGMFKILNAAFLVLNRSSDDVLGFATLHGLDPAGHLRCGIYLDPPKTRFGIGAEATNLLLNYAFACFNIDRVVAQTTEASFDAFGLGHGDGRERQVLAEHLWFRGQLWDLHTFQIRRDEWEEHVDLRLDGILPAPLDWRTAPR